MSRESIYPDRIYDHMFCLSIPAPFSARFKFGIRNTKQQRALELLPIGGRDLHIVPTELWVPATRPIENNGLGLAAPQIAAELVRQDRRDPVRLNCGY